MQIHVLFFGVIRDLVGRPAETLELPDGAGLTELLSHYENLSARMRDVLPSVAISVNQEYSGADRRLRAGDEVALLPPVSGGTGPSPDTLSRPMVQIVREPINTSAILEEMKQPEDGAAVVFEGVVRNHSRGRRTLYLDYDAYEPMALKQMNALVTEACSRFSIRETAIVHRLGRLQIGETSVLVVVASAHRAAAFEACRWIIDTLKKTVPIWKKEYFEDGAIWADGEPFPEEISRPGSERGAQPASK